ncbi:leucine-rich repeat and calponin homology domain-containing protein isoform X2 [Drosophila miranda]|uniref:leucine-rich repeat and calponin homology domain-containing protein isoform X2 n=1 Tax=Drosophila miranda TaxID=7229 RepID=UPI0007E65CDB|nr:leucine-rich repeat and calponin homology domain-containing protein isoform X2 [Drosophila miranda]
MAASVYHRLQSVAVGSPSTSSISFSSSASPGASSSSSALLSHSQLTRSLERILEEAHFSGELILTNRKLKDFPKTGTKYALTDTVIADLSRNRFCELPEEVTTFAFLETLLLYHNTIRSIPESVKQLSSLTYLDLRSNQLSSLPREICFLPLQVLLVSNNRLVSLPDELGRLDQTLTDLDASYNQLSALPARLGELRTLRSLSLRSNQLMYLPRELTCLSLVSLDVSNNRIASLPLEIRHMSTLVELQLENNPLTSPPASLCMRGLVHVFKFLETQATKDEKGSRSGGNYDGYTTLRRAPRHNSSGNVLEASTNSSSNQRRHQIDSGYSTSDGLDKRWSHDNPPKSKTDSPLHCSMAATLPRAVAPSAIHMHADLMDASLTSSTSTIVDESLTLSPTSSPCKLSYAHSNSSSNGSSPDQDEDLMMDQDPQERSLHASNGKSSKSLNNIQTYKEYKEALKQQRNQEISVYKQKHPNANHSPNDDDEDQSPPALNPHPTAGLINGGSSTLPKSIMKQSSLNSNQNGHNGNGNGNGNGVDDVIIPKKPIQKVIPSRNTEIKSASPSGNSNAAASADCLGYVKPQSPMKNGTNKFNTSNGGGGATSTSGTASTTSVTIKSPVSTVTKLGTVKTHRSVTWNHDIPAEKLSFTMRREFDRQREETELMSQLRSIIETRLKMTLPVDIASALTDGVILCHLANYVRPRSVASIHVPSPGVNKLTMARCRRNVDNFLEACRRIGVDEELICSCEDVVPQIEQQLPRADDDYDADVYVNNDDGINGSSNNHNNSYNNNHNNDVACAGRVPNALALLHTVSALIALDANPHHQQHIQQELHQRLQQLKHQSVVVVQQKEQQQQQPEQEQEQEQLTETTCSQQQEQMLQQQQQQLDHVLYENCEIINGKEANANDDVDDDVVGIHQVARQQQQQQHLMAVGQMLRTAKQKTFEKIKHNLLSAHGQHTFQSRSNSSNNNNRTLHTIVESEHDVATAGPAGHYHLIDEKQKQQQSKSEESKDLAAVPVPVSAAAAKEAISRRIEFFEQQRNGKPQVEVFSIYRIGEDKQQQEQLQLQQKKLKSKDNEAGTSLLKHDSHTLTVVLSCVFITTFLWLNLICCAADVLEGKGAVQVAITVGELFRLHGSGAVCGASGGGGSGNSSGSATPTKSPTRMTRATMSPTPMA